MDIGRVSKISRVTASTLRYYEEIGLIKSTGRKGLRRLFDPDIIDKLNLIKLGKQAGFSLNEIKSLLEPSKNTEYTQLKLDRSKLKNKADELDIQIKQLTAMRNGLRHAANCPAPSHFECSTFRRLLGITGKYKHTKAR